MARVETLEKYDDEPRNGRLARRKDFSVGSVVEDWFSDVGRQNNDQRPSLAFRKE